MQTNKKIAYKKQTTIYKDELLHLHALTSLNCVVKVIALITTNQRTYFKNESYSSVLNAISMNQ